MSPVAEADAPTKPSETIDRDAVWRERLKGLTPVKWGFVHDAAVQGGTVHLCVSGFPDRHQVEMLAVDALLRWPFEDRFCPSGINIHQRVHDCAGPSEPAACGCFQSGERPRYLMTTEPPDRDKGGVPAVLPIPALGDAAPQPSTDISPFDIETATHEAGHAIVGMALGLQSQYATIVPTGQYTAGHVAPYFDAVEARFSHGEVELRKAAMTMAGPEAHRRARAHCRPDMLLSGGCGSDYAKAKSNAGLSGDETAAVNRVTLAWEVASGLLDRHWTAVEALRDALLKYRFLHLRRIMQVAFSVDRLLEEAFHREKYGAAATAPHVALLIRHNRVADALTEHDMLSMRAEADRGIAWLATRDGVSADG